MCHLTRDVVGVAVERINCFPGLEHVEAEDVRLDEVHVLHFMASVVERSGRLSDLEAMAGLRGRDFPTKTFCIY
ncbi:hypothetical protein D3C77_677420 [compost metagenome]